MTERVVYRSNGLGFFTVLTIVFIILKLTNVITWSWWWVLSPLWIPWVIILFVILFVILFATIITTILKMLGK